jgi:hypothetical protein
MKSSRSKPLADIIEMVPRFKIVNGRIVGPPREKLDPRTVALLEEWKDSLIAVFGLPKDTNEKG